MFYPFFLKNIYKKLDIGKTVAYIAFVNGAEPPEQPNDAVTAHKTTQLTYHGAIRMASISAKSLVAIASGAAITLPAIVTELRNGNLKVNGVKQLSKSESVTFAEVLKKHKLELAAIQAPVTEHFKGKSDVEIAEALGNSKSLYEQWSSLTDQINSKLEAKFGKGSGWRLQPYCRNLK